MAKQLNVNLAFTADTGKAKAQIQELQSLLSKITYSGAISGIGDKINVDLQKASTAAKELQFHLNNAFNTTTGKFDLSLLDRSLKTSGANITQLSTQLLGAGATGQQAFLKLAQSISLADQPMLRVSNRMREFSTVMKNTIKWQLSSSMIHGFMGAINSAYGYAQDLNKSLTDIRIVTGNSADEMARFAEQANKTAKVLSTTTNDYAKASLIYFQQGLDDAEVQKRTDVTIKMANATGTSAQTVSDQMTAVWNNFDDGSKSLEYYADVMTALGAATASSTDEISQGLQKFAAVSETVGLSYEYATAALTAIMSNTRESADVVGTALKTLFARIQGLQLGETLEDGTDLNKYSQALESVGISIYESSGELKAMDNILNEMADKWDTLNNAQQTALAQTVAGVRQYTQLVALMENWDNGDADSFQANLKTISGAEGTLDEQAEIYAQSWEAAEKRVRASAEGIYQSLLDDKFFISLNNGFANVLTGIDSFIDGLGGVKPLITGITSIFISNFAHKIPQVLDNLKYNLQILTKSTKDVYDKMASDIYKVSNTQFQTYKDTKGEKGINEDSSLGVALKQANDLTAARTKLALVTDKMSESERQMANTSLSIIQQTQDEVLALTKKKEVLEKNIELQMKAAQSSSGYFNSYDLGETQAHKLENKVDTDVLGLQNFDGMSNLGGSIAANLSQNLFQVIDEANSKARSVGTTWEQVANTTNEKITSIKTALGTEFEVAVENIKTKLSSVNQEDFGNVKKQLLNFLQVLPSGVRDIDAVQKALHNLRNSKGPAELMKNFEALDGVLKGIQPNLTHSEKILSSIHGDKIHTLVGNMQDYNSTINEANSKTNILKTMLNEFQPTHVVRMSEAFGALGGMMGNVVTIGRSIKSAFDALNNPDLSGWEKFSTVLMSISMIIPGITSLMRGYATVTSFANTTTNAYIATKAKELAIKTANVAMDGVAAIAQKKNLQVLRQQNAGIWAEIVAKKANIDITTASTIVETALGGAKKISTAEAIKKITALLAENGVEAAGNVIKTKGIVLQTVLNALTGQYAGLLMLLGGGLIIGALIGVVKIFDALHTSQKEANEAIVEANEKYAEEKQKLDELNTSLEDVKKQIEELQSKGTLSLVEQEELNKLLEQEASLERQIALQERSAELAKQNSADIFEDNAEKAGKWMKEVPQESNKKFINGGYEYTYGMQNSDNYHGIQRETETLTAEEYKAKYIEPLSAAMETATGEEFTRLQTLYNQRIDMYNDWVAADKKALNDWTQEHMDSYNELIEGYQNWYDVYGQQEGKEQEAIEYAKLISDTQKAMYGDQYDEKVLSSVDNIFKASTNQKDKDVVNNIVKDLEDGIVNADPASIAEGFSDTFKQSLLRQGIIPDDYAQHLIDEYTKAASALKGEVSLEDLMSSEDFNLEDLDILAHLQLTGEEDLDELLAKIKAYKDNTIEVEVNGFDLNKWTEQFNVIKDLKIGDTIDPEKWNQLDTNMQQFFDKTIEGEYRLTVAADDLLNKLNDEIEAEIESQYKQIEMGERAGGKYYNDIGKSALSNNVTEGSYNKDIVQAQLDFLKSQGKDTSQYTEKLFDENGNFKTVKSEDIGVFNELAEAAANAKLELGTLNESLNSNQIISATASTSVDELRNKLNDGTIDLQEYNNAFDNILITEAESKNLDYESILNYAEYLSENAESLEDVDNALQGNLNTAKKVALVQAKLNKAVQTLSDNWEDWNKAIKKGDMSELQHKLPAINDALKDMLDLTDEAFEGLSDDFAIKNWDKIQDVVNGVEGALEDLQVTAAQDALINIKPEIEDSETLSEMTTLMDTLANTAEGTILEIDPKVNNKNAFDGLYELLTEAGFTIDQIADAFDKLGWTPEITYEEMTISEAQKYTGGGYQTVLIPTDDGGWEEERINLSAENDIAGLNKIKVPVIKGTKTSGGSGSYTPKNTSSGGGGGGGQKKHAEKKSSSEKTRYHTLQNQLEDLSDEYDEISDAADRAFGQDKLDAIDDQIDKTDELIDKQEEYLDAIEDNLKIDKATMIESWDGSTGKNNKSYFEKYFGKLPEIEFDAKGNISNYDELQDKMFQIYNKATQKWTEDSEEWQVFEKKYEQFEKYIEQYEETYDLLREEEAAYQELMSQRLDLQLEKVEYGIELKLNISEDDLSLLEYQFDLLEDKAFASAERIANSTQQANNIYNQILTNRQGLEEALGLSLSPGEITQLMEGDMSVLEGQTFTEAQIDAIKEYRDNLLDLNTELIEIQKQIEEQVLEAFDEWHEKLDEGMDKFDHYGNMLEGYKNIIDIVGKDVLGIDNEHIAKLSQTQVDNSINQLSSVREAYESYNAAAEEAERKMQESQNKAAEARAAGNEELAKSYEEDAKFWEDTYNEMDASAREAQEELMDTWGNTLESIVTQFELAVERAIDSFNDAIYQLGGLEGLSNDFSHAKERDDLMLDDYQKIYELSKLTRDINNSIDDTDNIAGKQKLKKLLEQINKLQEDGVEMSQYDLEYLQAEYDLRLAELELEEARNAKDTVRLSKDNEGNWSYIYTQNNDAVDAAQQKYEDALYAMQDLSSNYIDEMSEKLISTSQEMQEALATLRVEDFASLEDYYTEVDRIQRIYQEQLDMQEAELNKAIGNNKNLYENDWKNYSEATGYKISATENFVTSFKDSMLGTLIGSEEATTNFGSIIGEATTVLINNLFGAATDYYSNLNTAMEAAGTSTSNFADDLSEDVERIKTESTEAAQYVQQMADDMDQAIEQIIDTVHQWQEDYGTEIDKILNKNLELINSFNEIIKALSGNLNEIDISYNIKSAGTNQIAAQSSVKDAIIPAGTVSGATGMYTGDWGSKEGRVAVLHEKELLLNENDTINMLQMLELTRYLMEVIDINAQQLSQGMGALQATTIKDDYKEILEQQVSIQAEFPNVTDHNEIEEAFSNLINVASQYANRK